VETYSVFCEVRTGFIYPRRWHSSQSPPRRLRTLYHIPPCRFPPIVVSRLRRVMQLERHSTRLQHIISLMKGVQHLLLVQGGQDSRYRLFTAEAFVEPLLIMLHGVIRVRGPRRSVAGVSYMSCVGIDRLTLHSHGHENGFT
jgi:hypothetical protein